MFSFSNSFLILSYIVHFDSFYAWSLSPWNVLSAIVAVCFIPLHWLSIFWHLPKIRGSIGRICNLERCQSCSDLNSWRLRSVTKIQFLLITSQLTLLNLRGSNEKTGYQVKVSPTSEKQLKFTLQESWLASSFSSAALSLSFSSAQAGPSPYLHC